MAGGPWDDYAPSAAKKPSAGPWEDYAPEQASEPEKSGVLRRGIADTGVSLLRGAIAVPEAAVGIADIATGGRAGRAVQAAGVDFKRAKDIAGEFYSPEQKAANKAVSDADGFFPTIAAAVQNPSVIAQSGIESVPAMLGGGVAAQTLRRVAPKVGAVGAAGIGEGVVGAGSSAEQIRQATEDGLLTDKQAALAAGSGALTSVIGAAGGAAARRLGIGDIDTIIAQGGRDVGEATSKGILRRAGEGFVAEGALEEAPQSAQEQALQNIALDKPVSEGVGSAAGLGLLTGGAMGAAAAPFGARPVAGEPAAPVAAPVEPAIDAPTPAAAPGDPLRSAKLPESGPLSRGINTLIEGEAQAADAGAPVQTPVTGALAGVPAEDAAPQIPVGEATEVDPIPAGEATELPADQVQPAAGPTFDPATGEISQPQRATFPTREAVDEYLRQARLQQGGERAKAAPVELPDGTFSFLRPNEQGYEDALEASKQTVLQRKRAAAAKVKAEAEQAKPPSVLQQRRAAAAATREASVASDQAEAAAPPAAPAENPVSVLQQRRAAAAAAKAAPAQEQAPVAPVTKPLSVLQQRRAAALAAKQNAGAPAADTGALGSAPRVATPPTAPAPTADDTNQPRRVSTEAQAPADQAQPPARGDGATRVAEPAMAGPAAVQAAGVAPDLAGEKIDKEWTTFAPESGTKGVPRADMPQIKAEHRGAMTQFLGARGITHEQAEVPAGDLKPTQAEFSTKKVKAARDFSDTDRSILVSSDGHILDGHHQWLAARDAGKTVKVIRLDAPIDKLLAEVKEFPSAGAAQGATDKTSRTLSAPARSGAGVSNSLQGFAQYGAGPAERDLAERQAEAIVGVRFPVKRSGLNARVPALFRRTDGVVLINRDMQFSQAGLVEVLAEEFMHGVDSISPSRIISGSAKRLMPAGDIRQEVEAHFSAQGEFADFLTYPLHPIYGLEPARVRAELFARLALVYRSDARRMQAALPITYEAYHEFFSQRSDGRVREVPRPVQPAGRPGAGVRQDRGESQPAVPGAEALRPAEGRPAGGAGQREADSRLLELRRRAVDIFNGRRDGALYGGGLSSAESFDLGHQPANADTAAYGPATQAQRDLVAKLQQQLQARLPGVVLDAVAPSGRDDAGATGRGGSRERSLQGKSLAAVASVAKRLFNREVVFVRFTGDARFNGLASDAYPGKVFINVEANRPLMSVLGHELVHSMRASNPATYEALKRRLDGLLKNEQRYIDALEAKYAERGVSTKGVRHGEELHADIVGDFFMDPVFWQDMAKDKPGLFRRVANAVIKFLDDVSAQILDLRPFGTDQYLADIKAARAAVSTTLREFSAAAVGEATASTGGVAFAPSQRESVTQTLAFRRWFGKSKVVDTNGQPRVMYHGTNSSFSKFDGDKNGLIFVTPDPKFAERFATARERGRPNLMPVYVSAQRPFDHQKKVDRQALIDRLMEVHPSYTQGDGQQALLIDGRKTLYTDAVLEATLTDDSDSTWQFLETPSIVDMVERAGFDSMYVMEDGVKNLALFDSAQIKSAIGNRGTFDPNNPDITFSLADSLTAGINNVKDVKLPAGYLVQDLFNRTGKLHWWHKTVGTMNNLAQRSPEFKRVYDATQNFINDVSAYGTAAADLAPTILPKLENWRDITKSPLSPADTKAISAPIFEGTLTWARDGKGRPVKLASLEDAASGMSAQDKAQAMLRDGKVGSDELKRWQNLPIDSYEGAIRNRYEREYLTAGVVWKDAELRSMFGLNDKQIGLYKEFRAATDKSLTNLAISDMLRYGGDDVAAVRQAALDAPNIDAAAELLRDHLFAQAEADIERADVLNSTGNGMIDKADKAKSLMQRGYAPLSRFGQYTVYVTEGDEQRYFGMFESAAEANRMARRMKAEFPEATVQQGTVSQEAYKMFAGVSPETLELFGGMLGLETQGNDASSQAFQTYLKLAKSNRSAMKRLIQRKGIAGFSEDAGRVLAGFVYSNARQTSSNLHMGEMTKAASDVSKGEGEMKDQAVRLVDYVKNPQEEAQALRGLLFAQYLGGSVASAMVNVTQPFAVTLPYLSQYGGAIKAGGQMRRALADVFKKSTGDAALDAALKKAEDDGIVSPQEVHQLMAQAQGRGSLKSGDGTRAGDAAAKASNALSKLSLAWGKFFSTAEQFNRRITFIAAYRTAVDQGMADPAAFAADVVNQTQFTYNKGNKPAWARGAIGGTLFTFKQYSISYVELMNRLWRSGPEGKKAALLGLAILMLMSGVDELPFVEDAEDVIDGALQRLGYNFSTKQQREQFLTNLLGEGVGRFVQKGVSGLPGVPVDLSGRLGMGNLLPGTGLFTKKTDYSRDIGEFAGPAGDLAKRAFTGAGQIIGGDFLKGATTISPVAARNVVKAFDMAETGMYRDDRGRKVLDTTGYEAAAKAIGFQPTDVARVQDATGMQQRMIALVKIRETEIADRWAQGIFEKNPDKVAAARAELLDWNTKNPEAPIRIAPNQVKKRVQTMSQDKTTRIAKTAPAEIRDSVRRELAEADR